MKSLLLSRVRQFVRRSLPVLTITFFAACLPLAAHAKPRLPAVIGSNMVLQRDVPLTFWGWADPGEEITVAIGDNKGTGKANEQGRWTVKLAPMKASAAPLQMTVAGKRDAHADQHSRGRGLARFGSVEHAVVGGRVIEFKG